MKIYLRDLFEYVFTNVKKENSGQTPQYQGFGDADVGLAVARRLGATGEIAAVAPPYLQPVRDAVDNKEAIFFLGDGIYRDGPAELDAAYRGDWRRVETNVDGQTCLPTVAEEFQRPRRQPKELPEKLCQDHQPSGEGGGAARYT